MTNHMNTDYLLPVYAEKSPEGVRIFRDEARTKPFCTFDRANHARVPDRRDKYVMLNCYRWRLVWLDD